MPVPMIDQTFFQQQITLIQNDIHTAQTRATITLGVALLGLIGTIVASIISARASRRTAQIAGEIQKAISVDRTKHEKQWEYFKTQMALVNAAVDVMWRLIFNKLVLCDHGTNVASKNNLFLLEKDAFTIESLLLIYAPESFAAAVAEMRGLILSIPDKDFRKRWDEMYGRGREITLKVRKEMGEGLEKPFEGFVSELKGPPPSAEASAAQSMGTLEIKSVLFPKGDDKSR